MPWKNISYHEGHYLCDVPLKAMKSRWVGTMLENTGHRGRRRRIENEEGGDG